MYKTIIQVIRGYFFSLINMGKVHGNGHILIDGTVKTVLAHNSCIEYSGKLRLGFNSSGRNGRSSLIRIGKNAKMICSGDTRLFFDSDIQLFDDAILSIGDSFINSGCKIRVGKQMKIGDNCAIGTDFTAMDSNFHKINDLCVTKPVVIEDHVWIGTRVTVLPGVNIGEGAIIGAGSVVTNNIDPHCLAVGNPAKVIKRDVVWSI